MQSFNTCRNIYYKEEIEAERKFYPRIKALLRVLLREMSLSCTSLYTPAAI